MDETGTYKLILAYDGTQYGGWQIQPNAPSIQEHLQEALATILRHPVIVIGSGRTDAGVHAHAQVAHFKTPQEMDLGKVRHSLNGLLPPDIRIKTIERTAPRFHAQHSATGKTYHYHFDLGVVQEPFSRLYALHVRGKINLDNLVEAIPLFIGTHDFTSFSNEAHSGSAAKDPVRTIRRLDYFLNGEKLRLEFEGNGFLYKMVRNIVGTLLEVGHGKKNKEEIPLIFAARDRRSAGPAAPPHGLFLWEVRYADTDSFISRSEG